MTPQKIVLAVAAALAIGMLGLLLYASRERPIDSERQQTQTAVLREVTEAESQFRQQVVQSRLSLDPELRELAAARARLAQARAGLIDALESGSEPAQTALEAYKAGSNRQVRLADDHQVEVRLFSGAFRRLRFETDATLAALESGGPAGLRSKVTALASEAVAYGLRSEAGNAAELERLLRTVTAGAAPVDGEIRANLDRLIETVRQVRRQKDALQAVTRDLLGLPQVQALQVLEAALIEGERLARSDAVRYRQILPVYTVALLLAFGVIALRLRSSFVKLDEANAALRDSNVNLEKLVEARTGELRRALEDLRMQQTQLIQSEKMASLGQMVAGVAHEINTPLGYARSNLETVREALAEGSALDAASATEFGELLRDSDHGLEQIADLVMSLKNFSRMDRAYTEVFDLREGLETSLKIVHNQFKGRVEVERDYADLPPITCAPSQLNQVFLNILTNAGQAIEGPGRVRIRTFDAGACVGVAIRDSGCGMDEQTKAHIFEPFFTTKDVGEGTGLGLSIVFRIVEDHGGRVIVDSAPGMGTEFSILLPKQPAARSAPAQASRRPETVTA